jgi:hypothetical protein
LQPPVADCGHPRRAGIAEGNVHGLRVVNASHNGDDALIERTAAATTGAILVTADCRLL